MKDYVNVSEIQRYRKTNVAVELSDCFAVEMATLSFKLEIVPKNIKGLK
jgi:hypothetical protein